MWSSDSVRNRLPRCDISPERRVISTALSDRHVSPIDREGGIGMSTLEGARSTRLLPLTLYLETRNLARLANLPTVSHSDEIRVGF